MRTGRILHYDILERLGAGSMGEVFLAEDTRLGRRVVLKFLTLPETDGEEARRRLVGEARALAALSHPNIARVLALETAADTAFLVMEHVDGETLAELLSLGPLPPREVAHIGTSIAGALAHAHAHGVVHRDVKPENILVTEDGHVRLSDFGIASLRGGPGSERDGRVWGTPEYMSPEQARGDAPDGRSDQYALGVTLIEALTGEPPAPDADPSEALVRRRASEQGAAPSALAPGMLERTLGRCVRRDRARRFADCAALHADLARIQRQLEGASPPGPSRTVLVGAAVLLLVIGALVAGVVTGLVARRPRAVGPVRAILVNPIRVQGGQASDAYVGRALAEAIAVGLARATDLRVLPVPASAGPAAPGGGTSADLVLTGTIRRARGLNHASLELRDVHTGRLLGRTARDADDRQMPYLARAIADDVTLRLKATPAPRYDYFLYAIRSEVLGASPIASAALGAHRRSDGIAAMRWSTELAKRFPREAEAHVLHAYALLGRSWNVGPGDADRREFAASIARARRADPANPWPTVLEGLLEHREGRVLAAERVFSRVLARDDLTESARGFMLSLRGQAHRDLNEPEAALADLDEASRLDPTNVFTLVIHADALGFAGRAEEGLVRARQAYALDPGSGAAGICMAQSLARLARWTEAIPYIESACHRYADRTTLAQGAVILRHAGRLQDAGAMLALAEAATASDWGDFQLARYHAMVGKRARAIQLLRAASERGLADPEVLVFPEFDGLRQDAEFQAVVRLMARKWTAAPPLTAPTD